MRKQTWHQYICIHLRRWFPHTMDHRSYHDHFPDYQILQEKSTCLNDAGDADYTQCFRDSRLPHRSHGIVLYRLGRCEELDGLLWNNHCYVSLWCS
jgi:hypothetical protein